MIYENLLFEKNEGICTVKINNPNSLNSLNPKLLKELEQVFDQIKNDNDIAVVILTGEGKAFVAGADIGYMKNLNASEAKKFGEMGAGVFRKIETLNKPVIAAVNGYALGGGCELCMSCDIRIASSKAKFGQPEVGLGIIPGFSGTQRLPRIVGIGKAKELIFTGNIINSEEAFKIGLVNKVAEHDKLMEEAYLMADKIKSNSMQAVAYSKEAINRGTETDIETGIGYELNLFGLCFAAEDQKEGMSAFLEKRPAKFTSKI